MEQSNNAPNAAISMPTWLAFATEWLIRFKNGTVKPMDMCLFSTSVYRDQILVYASFQGTEMKCAEGKIHSLEP